MPGWSFPGTCWTLSTALPAVVCLHCDQAYLYSIRGSDGCGLFCVDSDAARELLCARSATLGCANGLSPSSGSVHASATHSKVARFRQARDGCKGRPKESNFKAAGAYLEPGLWRQSAPLSVGPSSACAQALHRGMSESHTGAGRWDSTAQGVRPPAHVPIPHPRPFLHPPASVSACRHPRCCQTAFLCLCLQAQGSSWPGQALREHKVGQRPWM